MATLAVQVVRRSGVGPTYAAATGGGDQVVPDKNTFLHVKNTSGAPITVTVAAQKVPLVDQTMSAISVSVPATTGERMIGPLPYEFFADGTGFAQITYSGVTNLTIAALQLLQP